MPGRVIADEQYDDALSSSGFGAASTFSFIPDARDLVLRAPPNWTAVIFFACLGVLHLILATLAFMHERWEGAMSLLLGVGFVVGAIVGSWMRFEVTFQRRQRRLRLRSGSRRMFYQRYIPFADVHGVRLTLSKAPDHPATRIEVLCDNEDIDCPPTDVPRQQALCLAVLMDVQLIKVWADGTDDAQTSDVFRRE
jgi:hypothetical protein